MKNPRTGNPMELVHRDEIIVIKGVEVSYRHTFFQGDGDIYTTTEQDEQNLELALAAYVEKTKHRDDIKNYLVYVLLMLVILYLATEIL